MAKKENDTKCPKCNGSGVVTVWGSAHGKTYPDYKCDCAKESDQSEKNN